MLENEAIENLKLLGFVSYYSLDTYCNAIHTYIRVYGVGAKLLYNLH